MPYPRKLLNDDETVAVDLHPHWFHFAEPVAALVGSIVLGIIWMFFDSDSWYRTALGWIAIVLIIGTAIWTITRYISWMSSHFVVTNQRIIWKSGWIRRHGIDIPLDRVNNVVISQRILERMLGAGDLLIESAGESGQQKFHDINHPERVQNQIYAQIQLEKQSLRGGGTVSAPPVDVAGQLERLEGMLERGTLTREEFEAQKQRLLEQ